MDDENALSDQEINEFSKEFMRIVSRYAKVFYKRYEGRINYDEINSKASQALFESLQAYRRDRGRTVRSWVARAVFDRCRGYCYHTITVPPGSAKLPMSFGNSTGDGDTPAIDYRLDVALEVQRNERIAAGRKIMDLALLNLVEDDRAIFAKKWIDEKMNHEIAADLGVTAQAVSARLQNILNRVRRIVKFFPELMAFDHEGIVRRTYRGPAKKAG